MRIHTSIRFYLILIFTAHAAWANDTAQPDTSNLRPLVSPSLQNDLINYPLKVPDTSSPRATLQSFLGTVNRSYRVLMAAHEINKNTPGLKTPDTVKVLTRHAEELLNRGVHCLDLSDIPADIRKGIAYDLALTLKEILDRIELPPVTEIPQADDFNLVTAYEQNSTLYQWQIPNTGILIARVEDGSRRGEYLFSAQSVNQINDYWNKIKHLPYQENVMVSKGYLDYYIQSTGHLLKPRWNRLLPAWTNTIYFSQSVWQWLAIPILLIPIWFVLTLVAKIFRPWELQLHILKRKRRQLFFIIVAYVLITGFFYILDEYVNLTSDILIVISTITDIFSWILMGWGFLVASTVVSESIISSPKIDPKGLQASYIKALFGVFGFFSSAVIIIFGLSRVGVTLLPLLTGVGIGGLAVALAARPTIENIIGSFMIFADNPFRVGHRVKVMGHDGVVEAIGLRSTRIRLLSGHVTSIPNEKMASSDVENIGERPFIKREFNVTITYDTPPEKIKRATELLHEILSLPKSEGDNNRDETAPDAEPHPNECINTPDYPPRVSFNELNADSLNIQVIYWYHPADYWGYLEHAQTINLQIMQRFNDEGIEFAFPTQTIYVEDGGQAAASTRLNSEGLK